MKLRVDVREPNNTGSPDYNICNQASSNVDPVNLGFKIEVDGEVILDTLDLDGSLGSFPISITTTANSIPVIIFNEVGYSPFYFGIVIECLLTNIWDSTTVKITATKDGYWTYSKSFEVYGYDLGQNPNLFPVTENNIPFTILLINKTNNEVRGYQTKAVSSFIAYRKPYTNEIHYYKSNSGLGDTLYYNSDLELISSVPDGFICSNDEYELKQINNLYGGSSNIISTCTSDLQTIPKVILIPTFEANTTCINCDDEQCSIIGANNTSTLYLNYTNISTYYKNDNKVYPYTIQNFIFRLIDFTGNIINEFEDSYTLGTIDTVFDIIELWSDFQIPEKGDYIIQVEINVTDLYKCIKNYPISSCNFYEIENTDCNEFTVYNKSFEDFTLVISELQNDKTFLEISSIVILALNNIVISHTEDNVYQYQVIKDDISYIYIVVNYCNLRQCLLLGLSNLICLESSNCDSCKHKDYYDFNSLIINAHTYFNMLNSEYNFNYLYEALSISKVNELYDLKSFLTRFKEYCVVCNKSCNC